MINELKDCLIARLSELITENIECILNDETNEVTYDDFLHFDAIENPKHITDKLQNVCRLIGRVILCSSMNLNPVCG
ncbi:hypothetical protein QTP88_006103 [Uroleucon formosanum]